MNIINSIKKFFRTNNELKLTQSESDVLSQLKVNKNNAIKYIVDNGGQDDLIEFISNTFSDHNLELIITQTYRNEISQGHYEKTLGDRVYSRLAGIKKSGVQLFLNYNIDSNIVGQILMSDIEK
jgi:hypothetical protein